MPGSISNAGCINLFSQFQTRPNVGHHGPAQISITISTIMKLSKLIRRISPIANAMIIKLFPSWVSLDSGMRHRTPTAFTNEVTLSLELKHMLCSAVWPGYSYRVRQTSERPDESVQARFLGNCQCRDGYWCSVTGHAKFFWFDVGAGWSSEALEKLNAKSSVKVPCPRMLCEQWILLLEGFSFSRQFDPFLVAGRSHFYFWGWKWRKTERAREKSSLEVGNLRRKEDWFRTGIIIAFESSLFWSWSHSY